jgi:hypothetical protein
LEQHVLLSIEPPVTVFDVGRVITIEDYQLLEVREFRIMVVNPTDGFRFCVNEIYADSEGIERVGGRKLPFCLDPGSKYPFYFTLFITEHKPMIYRASVYFIVSIYDGEELVDEKIWPREVIAKTYVNHLKIFAVNTGNCGGKNFTSLVVSNTNQNHSISVSFDS